MVNRCASIVLLLGAGSMAAQETVPSGWELDTPSFVSARYATGSASSLYAARGFGAVGAFAAMVHNPASVYSERIAGVYTRLEWNAQNVLFAVAYAEASEARYLQLYLMPELSHGRVLASGTIEWYEPIERSGVRQLDVNPVSVVVRVDDRWRFGAAYALGVAAGAPARHRLGPAAELALGWGTVRAEWLLRSAADSPELRVGVFAPL